MLNLEQFTIIKVSKIHDELKLTNKEDLLECYIEKLQP
jgi:hypothetical protein